ncbi:MAG: AAA family ATPase [Pseudomonadota bacterium]
MSNVVEHAKPKILCLSNQKGGVGKTTTTINLAASLQEIGARVLVIDLDPQGNASTGLGIDRAQRKHNSFDVLTGDRSLTDTIVKSRTSGVEVVPATQDLSSIDLELSGKADRLRRLRKALTAPELKRYDYVLIDCPPSLNLLTLNALIASNGVLVPLQCEFFALEGISQLLHTISEVRQLSNTDLITQGIILTMYDQRNRLTSDVEADVRETLGDLVLTTVIPRNVRLSEAPSHGLPVLAYDPRSSGALAYQALARELHDRVTQPEIVGRR